MAPEFGGKARAAGLGGVASFVPGAAGFMLVSATFRHRLCPAVTAGCRRGPVGLVPAAARAGTGGLADGWAGDASYRTYVLIARWGCIVPLGGAGTTRGGARMGTSGARGRSL